MLEDKELTEKREALKELVKKVGEAFSAKDLGLCGIDPNSLHFSNIAGFKAFVGKENFNSLKTVQNDSWIEVRYTIDAITVSVLL